MEAEVVIIGGGIAGLACAVALANAGLRPVVIERDGALGGRACSWTDEQTGDRVDIGPHILLSEYRNMLDLLEQLGTAEQICWEPKKFITFADKPRPVSLSMHPLPAPLQFLPSMLALPQISWRDFASNARLHWMVMRATQEDLQALDNEDAETVLRRLGVSERYIDWMWRTVAMAIMNVPLERCSAGALLSFFRLMAGRSGYKVGFAAVGLGDLFAPPATRIIEEAGGRVLLNCEAEQVLEENGGVSGLRLRDGEVIRSRHCVAALPPKRLRALMPPDRAQRHQVFRNLASFEASPYLSTYLWFDRKLTDERFWTRVWHPDNMAYDFYDLSNIRRGWSHRPSLIACNSIFVHRTAGLSDREVIGRLINELAEFAPETTRARVRHSRVHRIPMAIPAPYPGSERLRPDAATPIAGLFMAGDWVKTGLPSSMESAVRGGRLAAEAVLACYGRQHQKIALPLPEMMGLARLVEQVWGNTHR